jgi:hypothetical protein
MIPVVTVLIFWSKYSLESSIYHDDNSKACQQENQAASADGFPVYLRETTPSDPKVEDWSGSAAMFEVRAYPSPKVWNFRTTPTFTALVDSQLAAALIYPLEDGQQVQAFRLTGQRKTWGGRCVLYVQNSQTILPPSS